MAGYMPFYANNNHLICGANFYLPALQQSLVLQKDLFYGSISPDINSPLRFYSFLPPCKKCIYYTFTNNAPSDSTATGAKVEDGYGYQLKYAAELVKSIWCLDAVTYPRICSFTCISLGVINTMNSGFNCDEGTDLMILIPKLV